MDGLDSWKTKYNMFSDNVLETLVYLIYFKCSNNFGNHFSYRSPYLKLVYLSDSLVFMMLTLCNVVSSNI